MLEVSRRDNLHKPFPGRGSAFFGSAFSFPSLGRRHQKDSLFCASLHNRFDNKSTSKRDFNTMATIDKKAIFLFLPLEEATKRTLCPVLLFTNQLYNNIWFPQSIQSYDHTTKYILSNYLPSIEQVSLFFSLPPVWQQYMIPTIYTVYSI